MKLSFISFLENKLSKAKSFFFHQRRRSLNKVCSCSSQITQLTGFSDPVYAEAYVHVNQYDIVLDVLIVNQTSDMLQNCTLELATLGDLKLVERPQPMILGPMDFCSIKANVKVRTFKSSFDFFSVSSIFS